MVQQVARTPSQVIQNVGITVLNARVAGLRAGTRHYNASHFLRTSNFDQLGRERCFICTRVEVVRERSIIGFLQGKVGDYQVMQAKCKES